MAGEGRGFRESISGEQEPLTALAKRITSLPVIANGGLHDPDLADAVIQGEHADLISIGRAALATPDWPLRIAKCEPVVAFDHGMLSPSASIEYTDDWIDRNRSFPDERTEKVVRSRCVDGRQQRGDRGLHEVLHENHAT